MTQSTPAAGQAPRNYRPENIAGKNVVVSGGTTGIGRAVARLLVERGAKVLVFGRDENDLNETLQEFQALGEAHGVCADQSKLEDVRRIFQAADEKLGGVDILINNAAVFAGSILKNSAEEVAYGVNVNLVGYLWCAQEAISRMEKNADSGEDDVQIKGHIVNIGSLSAEAREEESDVYVATKAAIQAFSESLRKGVNERGVKVSLIEPGLVWSDMIAENNTPEEGAQKQREGKMLQEEDLAEAVHYVLTQPARCDIIGLQIRPHNQPI
jgi:NADP-dependent 3-hydroxy acid dehydrogenase YdfG